MDNSRILITGGYGFIGSHLANQLYQNYPDSEIHVIDISPTKNPILSFNPIFHSVDLCNLVNLSNTVSKINPDYVFHLGAFLNPQRRFEYVHESISINILGTSNLLHSLKDLDISRFLHMSTSEIYGSSMDIINEKTDLDPLSPYAASKIGSEYFTQMLSKWYNIPITLIRSFNVYGEGQSDKMLIPNVIIKLLKNIKVDISPGEQKRDFNYVGNIIDGLIKAANSKKAVSEIINLGEGSEIMIKDLVNIISDMIDSSSKIMIGSLPYRNFEIMRMCNNPKKSKSLLDWDPKINLDKGLRKTITWYQNNI